MGGMEGGKKEKGKGGLENGEWDIILLDVGAILLFFFLSSFLVWIQTRFQNHQRST